MNNAKEKLDLLLDVHAKAAMERVDWQGLNNAISIRLDDAGHRNHRLISLAVYKIVASILIIAGMIFTIVAVRYGESTRQIPHGHATLLAMPSAGKAVVTIDYGRNAVAVVRTASSEPAATCTLEIIDLEKYGYKYYKGASYTVIVMKTTNNY